MATRTFCDRCKQEVEKPGDTVITYGYRNDAGEYRSTSEEDLCKACEDAYLDFMDNKTVSAYVPD